MLFKTGVDLHERLSNFIAESDRLSIFVPYIKLKPLVDLINKYDNISAVFVRWEPRDIMTGASDSEVYLYLKDRGISLYRNPRIHLKAFVDDNKRCYLGSANISSRALNCPKSNNYNYELGTVVDNLSIADQIYFSRIKDESLLITDYIYGQILEQIAEMQDVVSQQDDFKIILEPSDKDFLISSLPMTYSFEDFEDIYHNQNPQTKEELNCFLHDLTLYNISLNLSKEELYQQISYNFFKHPFISTFIKELEVNKELRFGSVRAWIQQNCADAPTPRRWEITENIQILYKWVVALGNGRYKVYQPNHTQILQVVKS